MFWLGTHRPNWLEQTGVPLFISRRRLADIKRKYPRAIGPWVLDSGGFTELSMNGEWSITVDQYAAEVDRYCVEIGNMRWCAPMDWMCEPNIVAKTGLTVREHQARTIDNFLWLRDRLGYHVIPVLQGWTREDYRDHIWDYAHAGVYLEDEPLVGVGSICRRGQDDEIVSILDQIAGFGIRTHGFGVRSAAMERAADIITSADSMAWSYAARSAAMKPGYKPPACGKKSCANCLHAALEWREAQLTRLAPQRLTVAA